MTSFPASALMSEVSLAAVLPACLPIARSRWAPLATGGITGGIILGLLGLLGLSSSSSEVSFPLDGESFRWSSASSKISIPFLACPGGDDLGDELGVKATASASTADPAIFCGIHLGESTPLQILSGYFYPFSNLS